jgi:hypothetical protein
MLRINKTEPDSDFNSTIADNMIKSLGGKEEGDGMSWFVYEKKGEEETILNKGK